MFKNQLQELCHRRRWKLPEYEVTRHRSDHIPSFLAVVTVNGSQFRSTESAKSSKEAHNLAARAAFEQLVAEPPPPPESKPSPAPSSSSSTSFSALVSYKSQLQSFAQKKNKNPPVYTSKRENDCHPPLFKATVEFDDQTFESPECCYTIKDAEQAAARVALFSLPDWSQQDNCVCYKNLLQELAQIRGFSLPTYKTVWKGQCQMLIFTSTVEVQNESFEGDSAGTKKQAEINAAKIAWTRLVDRNVNRVLYGILPAPKEDDPVAQHFDVTNTTEEGSEQISSLSDGRKSSFATGIMDAGSFYCNHSAMLPREQLNWKEDDTLASAQVLQPITAAKNADTLEEDKIPEDESLSSSRSVCYNHTLNAADNKNQMWEADYSLFHNRVQVYPRKHNMVSPEGATVLFSSDEWIAIGSEKEYFHMIYLPTWNNTDPYADCFRVYEGTIESPDQHIQETEDHRGET